MGDRLRDKVAIVTGGGDGIGRGVVRRFASEGARVLVAEIDDDNGARSPRPVGTSSAPTSASCTPTPARRTTSSPWWRLRSDAWGTVDVLVNNAWGGGTLGRIEATTDEQMQWGFSLGLLGPFWGMRAVLPDHEGQANWRRDQHVLAQRRERAHGNRAVQRRQGGLARREPHGGPEWAPWQIRVNVICPGAKTAASRAVFAAHPELEAAADATNPMGRLGDPEEDIAPVAVFLASDDARYVTGNTLFVDGGGHINGVQWAPDLGD